MMFSSMHLAMWLWAALIPFSVLGGAGVTASLYHDSHQTPASWRVCQALIFSIVVVAIGLWLVPLPDGCQYLTPGSFLWYAAGCWLN